MNGKTVCETVSSPKILIVEDNIEFSNSLYTGLSKLSNKIKTATNGKFALDLIKKFNPDILLLDLKIPYINGLELLSKIRHMKIDVIIISSEINLLNQISMESYDIIKCVLIKPVNIKSIYNNVNYLLEVQEKNKILVKLKTILNEFEFNKSSNGYNYLLESLIEIFNYPEKLNNIEQSVYTVIAAKHDLDNINRIKWCIIKCLKSMYRYTDKNVLSKYSIDTTKITPKNFMLEMYNIIEDGDSSI